MTMAADISLRILALMVFITPMFLSFKIGKKIGKRFASFHIHIYAKIYTENFPSDMQVTKTTGNKLYKFLMRDCGCADDKGNKLIPGDSVIWYLGLCEKFGQIRYKDAEWNFGFGEASFNIVKEFVYTVYYDGHFTTKQFHNLMQKILEGEKIKDMYSIGEYLANKR